MPRNSTTVKKKLSNAQRQAIYHALLQRSVNEKLKKGTISDVAAAFSVCKRTISRIWHQAKVQVSQGQMVDVSSKMSKVVGRKRVQIDLTAVSRLPLRRRSNNRADRGSGFVFGYARTELKQMKWTIAETEVDFGNQRLSRGGFWESEIKQRWILGITQPSLCTV